MIAPIELGKFRLYPLLDGFFHLDGGSLFGVVPRALWARSMQPDDRNRIRLSIRPLLVEAGSRWILVDSGIGDKFDAKWTNIYGIERAPTLESQFAELGLTAADIDVVVNTHLHWDHAGGNTRKDASDNWVSAFPNARFVTQRGEYESATHLNERTRPSYRTEDYESLYRDGLFDFIDGDHHLGDGVTVVHSPGHVPYHQSVLLESGKTKAFFLGDLVSTHAHLPLTYITAFDLDPLETLEQKRKYLSRAVEEDWLLFFVHDPDLACGKVEYRNGTYRLKGQEP
jgi:glyoxylase-like metal-dependent hydrolase (beta-lactamase superfamily II)